MDVPREKLIWPVTKWALTFSRIGTRFHLSDIKTGPSTSHQHKRNTYFKSSSLLLSTTTTNNGSLQNGKFAFLFLRLLSTLDRKDRERPKWNWIGCCLPIKSREQPIKLNSLILSSFQSFQKSGQAQRTQPNNSNFQDVRLPVGQPRNFEGKQTEMNYKKPRDKVCGSWFLRFWFLSIRAKVFNWIGRTGYQVLLLCALSGWKWRSGVKGRC